MFKEHGLYCPMLSPTLFKIYASKIWATTLTFQGHVTSPVKSPFGTPGAISCRCSITEFVSPAVFLKIMDPRHCGYDRHLSRSRDVRHRHVISRFAIILRVLLGPKQDTGGSVDIRTSKVISEKKTTEK